MVRIGKLMKRNLVSVRSDETAFGACLLMRVLNVGSVFVKEQDAIIGIVTESDIGMNIARTGHSRAQRSRAFFFCLSMREDPLGIEPWIPANSLQE